MYTFGFHWKPWESAEPIAKGEAILTYLREAAEEAMHNARKSVRVSHHTETAYQPTVLIGGEIFESTWIKGVPHEEIRAA